jgi:hypothetical protein
MMSPGKLTDNEKKRNRSNSKSPKENVIDRTRQYRRPKKRTKMAAEKNKGRDTKPSNSVDDILNQVASGGDDGGDEGETSNDEEIFPLKEPKWLTAVLSRLRVVLKQRLKQLST